jgi:hypothetical protein
VQNVQGQNVSMGTATSITISEKKVTDGDIISTTKQGYKLSAIDYDPFLFGVVSLNPALYLEDTTATNTTSVITAGKAYVRVTTKNGTIKRNDFITSSEIAGVGQKAVDNGYVIGTAEENYTEKNTTKVGKILITLSPHYAQLTSNISTNIFNGLRLGMSAALLTPIGALRYIISSFIALLSFYFGFQFFGYASRSGVEAIGRNPLASKSILFSIAMNVIVTVAIMFFGVAIAYVILVL